ncbi:MAG: methylenetetrahydrofolate reductase [Dehalococcoidia bacterium]|nr:methylenetetrahydrofolate reductase [Dehalococcoidia bacterium]
MNLREKLAAGRFVITCEVGPPKGVDVTEMKRSAERVRGKVDAVNVTDQQSSVMRLGSLAGCCLLNQWGMEPVFQITCRDRNRIALQSDLLSAYALGIENVLCLTGDYVTLGDHPQAKPVFDLDSVSLIETARELENGHDLAGKELNGAPRFFVGACVSPEADFIEPQIMKMEKKVEAGAQFFQTQAIYDARKFADFMSMVRHLKVPVLAGIVVLRSAAMGRYMNEKAAGIRVPENLIDEMDKASDKAAKGVEIAVRTITGVKGLCQGVHIIAIGQEKRTSDIIDAAGL